MTCAFWFYIVVENFKPGDGGKLAEVFVSHGLHPNVQDDCIQADEKIHLPSGTNDNDFIEAFTDAVWNTLGYYVPATFSWTYIEELDEHQRFREDEYAEWQERKDHARKKNSAS